MKYHKQGIFLGIASFAFFISVLSGTTALLAAEYYDDQQGQAAIFTDIRESSVTNSTPLVGAPSLVTQVDDMFVIDSLRFNPVSFATHSYQWETDVTASTVGFLVNSLSGTYLDSITYDLSGDWYAMGSDSIIDISGMLAISVLDMDGMPISSPVSIVRNVDDYPTTPGADIWSISETINLSDELSQLGLSGRATRVLVTADTTLRASGFYVLGTVKSLGLSVSSPAVGTPTTRWVGGNGNWITSANWDAGVPNSQVDAVIDKTWTNVTIESNANAKSLVLDHGSELTVKSGGNVNIKNNITQNLADLHIEGSAVLQAQNIDLSGDTLNKLTVSNTSSLRVDDEIRLSSTGNLMIKASLSVDNNGYVRARSITDGLAVNPIGTKALHIDDAAIVDVDYLKVGNLEQAGGTLFIRNTARIKNSHNLSSGAVLEIYENASYSAKSLSISDSTIGISDRTSFMVDGNQVDTMNTHIAFGRIMRNGSPSGLTARLDKSGNTSVVYAPSLDGDLGLSNSGFHNIEVHNAQGSERDNLVVMVHGWNSSSSSWQELGTGNMVATLGNRLINGDWDVATYDWEENADDPFFILSPSPWVKTNAHVHGVHLAQQIISGYGDTEMDGDIHLIAHSLGGRVIDSASRMLREHGWTGTIHLTFLDAYTPDNWESTFGSEADWADHYYHRGLAVNTQDDFAYARNVDITDLMSLFSVDVIESHAFPKLWYHSTIDNPQLYLTEDGLIPYGFSLSQEATYAGWNTPDGMPEVGVTDALTSTVVIRPGQNPQWVQKFLQPQELCIINSIDPVYGTVEVVDYALSMVNGSPPPVQMRGHDGSGTSLVGANVELLLDDEANALSTSLVEPVWANVELLLDDEANALSFDFEFPLDANGVLTVFVNGEPVWSFVEEFALMDDLLFSGLIPLDGILPEGMHSLGFRLDSLDDSLSSVLISNIQTSLIIAVPEPSAIAIFLGGGIVLIVLVGRRRCFVALSKQYPRAK